MQKAATPAFPGQRGFAGRSLDDDAVLLRGRESEEPAASFCSTVHGAGRLIADRSERPLRNERPAIR